MKKPQQARSEATLRKIEQATLQLLKMQELKEFSLRQVADLAEISQGTLYARFPTKSELLNFVHERFCEQERLKIEQFVTWAIDSKLPFKVLLEEATRYFIRNVRETRTLARAFFHASGFDEEIQQRRENLSRRQCDLVLACARQTLGEDAAQGVVPRLEALLLMVLGTVRNSLDSKREYSPELQISDEELSQTLVSMVLQALGQD